MEPRLRKLLQKYSSEEFEELVRVDSGQELRKLLYLDHPFFSMLALLGEDYQKLVKGCLAWLEQEIPSWFDNEYGEVLKSEAGRRWLRRGLSQGLIG